MTEPRYRALWPWVQQWWLDRLDTPPLIVIRCGSGGCTRTIGEVKRDGEHVIAMSKNEHPEPAVPWTPVAADTAEELDAAIAERDRNVLRSIGTGSDRKLVFRRRPNLPRALAPVDALHTYSCREHGEVTIDVAVLAAFVADTDTPKRTYWAHVSA